MARDVMGQGDRQAQFFSDSFQISVDTMGCVDILCNNCIFLVFCFYILYIAP